MQTVKSRTFGTPVPLTPRADPIDDAINKAQSLLGQLRAKSGEMHFAASEGKSDAGSAQSALPSASALPQYLPARQADTQLAQLVIPIPKRWPIPMPPLFFDRGGRRKSPPGGTGAENPRKSEEQCERELAANEAACVRAFPYMSFPSTDLWSRERHLCNKEAFRVYSDCLAGRMRKPFDPYLFYEE